MTERLTAAWPSSPPAAMSSDAIDQKQHDAARSAAWPTLASEKRVGRLMREERIQGKVPKRSKQTTNSDHTNPSAPNLLDRDFMGAAPNQRWVGDTTEFVIGESAKLFLAAILDLFSRFVAGWASVR